jgi:hypothetical protein
MKLCQKPIAGRSKFEQYKKGCCSKAAGHIGPCEEFPYLSHMNQAAPRVAAKIVRDSTKTTGAAWKSAVAGPNRMDRWGMLPSLSDKVLKENFNIDLVAMGPSVQSKLREKAATYEDCMAVAAKLTWAAYQMKNAPEASSEIARYLSERFGKLERGSTRRSARARQFDGVGRSTPTATPCGFEVRRVGPPRMLRLSAFPCTQAISSSSKPPTNSPGRSFEEPQVSLRCRIASPTSVTCGRMTSFTRSGVDDKRRSALSSLFQGKVDVSDFCCKRI